MGGTYQVAGQYANVTYDLIPKDAYALPRLAIEVAATPSVLTADEIAQIGSSSGAYLAPAGGTAFRHRIAEGDILAPIYYGTDARSALRDLLLSFESAQVQLSALVFDHNDIMVPVFGSPPTGWVPLNKVIDAAQHAALVPSGWEFASGNSHSGIVMLIIYGGSQVMVRIVQPCLSATGEGLSAMIRRVFKL